MWISDHNIFLVVVALFAVLLRWSRHYLLFSFALLLPGTILHECAHWLVAFFLRGHPGSISIVPHRTGPNRYRLGQVAVHQATWYNAAAIGLAPLLLLIPAVWLLLHANPGPFSVNWIPLLLEGYSTTVLLASAWPSSTDYCMVFRGFPFLVAVLLLGGLLYWRVWAHH